MWRPKFFPKIWTVKEIQALPKEEYDKMMEELLQPLTLSGKVGWFIGSVAYKIDCLLGNIKDEDRPRKQK